MVWNQGQDLKDPKVYNVQNSCVDITCFLQSLSYCFLPPGAPSVICLWSQGQSHWLLVVWKFKSKDTTTLRSSQDFWCTKLQNVGFLLAISGPASALRPRAIVALGVHRGAFWQQELCSLDFAAGHRLVERRSASGAFPGPSAAVASADDGTEADAGKWRKLGSWAPPVQPTKERWILWIQHLQIVQSKIQSQTHRTSFKACCFQQITFNETMSINRFNSLCTKNWKAYVFKTNQCHQISQTVSNMIWNQVQDLKGSKLYKVQKSCGSVTSFLQSPFVL